jgi:hypothetical protein
VSDSTETVGSAPTGEEAIGTAAAPAKKKNPLLRILGSLVLAAVVFAGYWFFFQKDNVGSAKVGDCMPASVMNSATTSVEGVDKVDCTSAEADQKVLGIVGGKKESEVTAETAAEFCAPYPTAESFVWIGKSGEAGDVFCLAPVKK